MWYDRDGHKETIREWLRVCNKFSVINVADANQEMMDSVNWIRKNSKQYLIAEARCYSSTVAKKHALLDSLILNLGGKSKFSSYHNYLNNLEKDYLNNLDKKYDKYNIDQRVANQSTVKKKLEINHSNQIVNIYESNNERKPSQILKEDYIDEFLDKFIFDLNNFNCPLLFLIQFPDKGFVEFTKDFQQWFSQIFCRKLLILENIHICVLNQSDWNISLDTEHQENIVENLTFKDIIKGAEPHIEHPETFARTLACSDDKVRYEISYTTVRRALSRYLKHEKMEYNV